ncbi:prepilin-type N-terminal cleavage/methylation domain-containing protein [Caloramator sp. mosi_1]|uniref:pilus assembly FimT family protein n=1 Tax=Caloramator sp. mosi_1 TaxID=3023090 RepID=UPI00235EAEEE|nr:prepilin-type N-terminal cleavage/methylation domain-containing protein [Caloramator sp. mosi_1]WDC83225.1 prepilin-type N-terminal cleavage/methylation domain-containing protein [Caloramator sp. mosi_1]
MRKKGFTLVEMTIVIAILGILLSISYINFTKSIIKSQMDSAANEVASMLKDVYENGNKSMDYNAYYLKIEKEEGTYKIKLFKNDKEVSVTEYKNIDLEIKWITQTENRTYEVQIENYIYFSSEGEAVLKYDKTQEGEGINQIIIISKSKNVSKKITIESIPPGSIKVE